MRHSLLLKIAWIADLEASINYNEDDVAELQKNLYDHRAQLDKCKKDLLYLEAYSKREKNVKIFAVPQATGNENASEPEDTKEIVHNFFEQELRLTIHEPNMSSKGFIAWANQIPHHQGLLLCGSCGLLTRKKL